MNNNVTNEERKEALLKLSAYLIFFCIIILMVRNNKGTKLDTTSSSEDVMSSSVELIDFNYLKEKLLSNKYNFKYAIYNADNLEIEYSGNRDNSYFTGYKITSSAYTKFIIEDGKVYESRLNTKVESTSVFDSVDMNFLDSEYIINYTNEFNPIISDKLNEKEYHYNINDMYDIVIYMNINEIYKIDIKFLNSNYKYVLTYTYD